MGAESDQMGHRGPSFWHRFGRRYPRLACGDNHLTYLYHNKALFTEVGAPIGSLLRCERERDACRARERFFEATCRRVVNSRFVDTVRSDLELVCSADAIVDRGV